MALQCVAVAGLNCVHNVKPSIDHTMFKTHLAIPSPVMDCAYASAILRHSELNKFVTITSAEMLGL